MSLTDRLVYAGKEFRFDPNHGRLQYVDSLARKLWQMAVDGDHQAIEWIWTRLDGPADDGTIKVKHEHEHTVGIDWTAIDRIIDRRNTEPIEAPTIDITPEDGGGDEVRADSATREIGRKGHKGP